MCEQHTKQAYKRPRLTILLLCTKLFRVCMCVCVCERERERERERKKERGLLVPKGFFAHCFLYSLPCSSTTAAAAEDRQSPAWHRRPYTPLSLSLSPTLSICYTYLSRVRSKCRGERSEPLQSLRCMLGKNHTTLNTLIIPSVSLPLLLLLAVVV